MTNLKIDQPAFFSAVIGFTFAAGTWMSRPYGVNALDFVVIPVAAVVSYKLFRSVGIPRWLVALTLSLVIGVLWPPVLLLTAATTARVAALCVFCYWIWARGSVRPLLIGLMAGFTLQALLLPLVMFESRSPGIAPTISMLGMVGFIASTIFAIERRSIPWYFSIIGALTIAASGARSPLLAAAAVEIFRRPRIKYLILLIGFFVVAVYFQGGLHRINNLTTVFQAAEVRLASAQIQAGMSDQVYEERYRYLEARADGTDVLIDDRKPRPLIERIRGVGVSSYHAVIGWPRPHNIFTLGWREMGLGIFVPVAILIIAFRRKLIGPGLILGLAIYGLLDDSMLSANGHYGLTAIILVEAMNRKRTYAL